MRFIRFTVCFASLFALIGCQVLNAGIYHSPTHPLPTEAELAAAKEPWGGAGKTGRTGFEPPKSLENPRIITLAGSEGFPRFGQRSSPLAVGGLVVVGTSEGYLTALDASSREIVWRFRASAGISSTPVIAFGKIFVADEGGNVNALDFNGKSLWNVTLPYPVFADLLVERENLYVLCADQKLYAFKAGDGTPLWQYGDRMPRESTIWKGTSVAAYKESVYLGTSEGYLVKIAKESGTQLWKVRVADRGLFPDVTAGPSIEDGVIYAGTKDGSIAALDADTGAVLWRKEGGGAAGFALTKEALYYGNFKGEITALKKNGDELWKVSPAGREETPSFVLAAGSHILAGYYDSGVYLLDGASGKTLASFSTGSGVGAPPFVGERGMILHSNAGNLYIFDAPR
jgi:outer membrane protein assembly factor BamB